MMKRVFPKIKQYFREISTELRCVLFSVSILMNVIFGGKPNQTLSAGSYDRKRNNKFNFSWVFDLIFNDDAHSMTNWIEWKTWKTHKDESNKTIVYYENG